jgi:4-amino-4-deoxy-L-arabinose transferase-like glycosyltransferase
VLGVNELAARLPVAVATTLLVFLVFWFGSRCFGERAGALAAAALALNPLVFGTARQMTMDMHQSLWFAVAMVSFYLGYTARTRARERWYYGFWAGCGLAFMAKSVPGLLPIAAAFVFLLVEERLRPRAVMRQVWRARPIGGIALLLAIVLPWHLLAYRAHGQYFWHQYFLYHHVQLLSGKDFGHVQPVWYYLPALAAGFFPWSVFLVPALRPARYAGHEPRVLARRYVLVWALVVVVLFTGMTSKLISYLLPMYAAAALMVGDWLAQAWEDRRSLGMRVGMSVVACLAVGAAVAAVVALHRLNASSHGQDLARTVSPALQAYALRAIGVVAAGSAAGAALAWLGRQSASVLTLISAMALMIGLTVGEGLRAYNAALLAPLHTLVRRAAPRVAAGTAFAYHSMEPWRPSIYFHLPDSALLAPPSPAYEGHVLLDTRDPEQIDLFLSTHRPALVLADRGRADALLARTPGLVVEDSRGVWVLLRADPLAGGAGTSPARP